MITTTKVVLAAIALGAAGGTAAFVAYQNSSCETDAACPYMSSEMLSCCAAAPEKVAAPMDCCELPAADSTAAAATAEQTPAPAAAIEAPAPTSVVPATVPAQN